MTKITFSPKSIDKTRTFNRKLICYVDTELVLFPLRYRFCKSNSIFHYLHKEGIDIY